MVNLFACERLRLFSTINDPFQEIINYFLSSTYSTWECNLSNPTTTTCNLQERNKANKSQSARRARERSIRVLSANLSHVRSHWYRSLARKVQSSPLASNCRWEHTRRLTTEYKYIKLIFYICTRIRLSKPICNDLSNNFFFSFFLSFTFLAFHRLEWDPLHTQYSIRALCKLNRTLWLSQVITDHRVNLKFLERLTSLNWV